MRTDPFPSARLRALEALGSSAPDDTVVDVLSDALADPVVAVRTTAALLLGRTGDPRHNGALLHCFMAGEPELDAAAVAALTELNRADVMTFLTVLAGERNEMIQRGGAAVLRELADPAAFGLLNDWLDASAPVQIAAIHALGRLATVAATDALVQCLVSGETVVRMAAAKALAEGKGAITPGPARAALIRCLGDPDDNIRISVVQLLIRVSDAEVAEALVGVARDPSLRVRLVLAKAIATSDSTVVLPLIEQLCLDPEDRVRVTALASLLKLGDVDATMAFVAIAAEQPERVHAALRRLGPRHPAVTATLALAGADTRPEARIAGLRALATLSHLPAALIAGAMAHPSLDVRLTAIDVGGTIDAPEIAAAMQRLTRDPEPRVRERRARVDPGTTAALVPDQSRSRSFS